jgi:hypothetical protein
LPATLDDRREGEPDTHPTHVLLQIGQRPRPLPAKRFGISRLEIALVVVIIGVATMFVMGAKPRGDRSPFALFGVAPGMTLAQLQKAVIAQQQGKIDCRPQFTGYRYCVLKFSEDAGMVAAVIDPKKRVVVVEAVRVEGLDRLQVEAQNAQVEWNRHGQSISVPPLVDRGDTGAVRWSAGDRWTAELHFNGSQDPDPASYVLLVDEKAIEQLAKSSDDAAESARQSGWIPPTAEEAAAAFEKHRADRQSDYGAMATTLTQLGDFESAHYNTHHSYTDNVSELSGMFIIGATHLEILSATDSGWTAKAMLPGYPHSSCVAIGGRVAATDWPVTAGGRSITSANGVTCDPLPALETPSLGRS